MTFALDPRSRTAGAAMATWAWAREYRDELGYGTVLPAADLGLCWVGRAVAEKHAELLVELGFWELKNAVYIDRSVDEEQLLTRRAMERGKKRRWRASKSPPPRVDMPPETSTPKRGLSTGTKVDTSTVAGGQMVLPTSPSPSPSLVLSSSPSPSPPLSQTGTARARATRIPAEYEPSEITVALLKKEGFASPLSCLPSFRDYWTAKPGANGTKLDWDATYRNWVRRDGERARPASNMYPTRIVQQPGPGGPAYELGYEGEAPNE